MKKCVLLIGLTLVCLASNSQAIPDTWWNNAVFYEIFVRSFNDSDGDGIGDFQGIIQKLDHLNDGNPATTDDLGITGIWLMPINPSPSYHGYDVTDYFAINPDYGTQADFEAFLAECATRGIKVIIDFVGNHSSEQHPHFISSASSTSDPLRDYYVWSPTNPGGGWHLNNGSWYYGLFWSGMPDWNILNPDVVNYHNTIVDHWLNLGVDGFRFDAVKHLAENNGQNENQPETFTYLQNFYSHYKGVDPEAICVGEVWSNTETIAQYGPPYQDFCFEFGLANAMKNTVQSDNPGDLLGAMATVQSFHQPGAYAPFLSNHDQDRIFSQLGGNTDNMKLASAIMLTLPGVPFIYYGEEIGMTGTGADPNKRTPMQWADGFQGGFTTGTPWSPVQGDVSTANVAIQDADPNSILNLYREFVQLRIAEPSLRRGTFQQVDTPNGQVLAYLRNMGSESILVVHNLSGSAASGLSLTPYGLCGSNFEITNLRTGADLGSNSLTNGSAWTLPESLSGNTTAVYKLVQSTPVSCAYNLTVQVDMVNEVVDPAGVFLVGNFNAWDPTATPMSQSGSIWSAVIMGDTGDALQYRFVNGSASSNEETVPGACGMDDGSGTLAREISVGTSDATIPLVCFGTCAFCETGPVEVTFLVNLDAATPSPDGVHIAGSFQSWDPGTTAMTNVYDNVWAYTSTFDGGSYLEYKFINGNAWGQDESVPGACSTGINRFHTVGSSNETIPAVCYATCDLCPGAGVEGCTDGSACNFDPAATVDDGSCDYSCFGCTNMGACNYDGSATIDDGSCDFTCLGCTDPGACNYDVSATIDDGSCDFTCLGCTNPAACNYDASATTDDGSCNFDCLGCTYALAENYSALAITDDGSCIFGNSLCGPGTEWDIILQMCVTSGTSCATDLDGNGSIGTGDLLELLAAFGNVCP